MLRTQFNSDFAICMINLKKGHTRPADVGQVGQSCEVVGGQRSFAVHFAVVHRQHRQHVRQRRCSLVKC